MAQFYPEEVIQEVRASNDIVDVVSEYVQLKRSGSYLKGLCPFHREKTPSFSVSPDKQLFYCFGCGTGGTVLNFIMRIENLDFIETVKLLAERARIRLPEGNYLGDDGEQYRQKQAAYKINTEAAKFYYQALNSSNGENARKYLADRRIHPKTIVRFGLGYALDTWDALKEHLLSSGFDEKDILASGLIIHKSENTSYDRFRNRLMFPILDVRGNVIGFGGRVLDNSQPKYLNSPETVVFNKSKNLFGLNFAKNVASNTLIIVEGYMDVVMLHQQGITNAVASLGTALTREQAMILGKYCNEVIIAYDSDAAGQAAVLRGMDILNNAGCKVKILYLEDAKDPDEFIRIKGVERFKNALNESKGLIEYKIELLRQKYNINNIDEKIAFVNESAVIFAQIENLVERDAYIQKISSETSIATEAILSEIKKYIYRNRKDNRTLTRFAKANPSEITLKAKNRTSETKYAAVKQHSKIFMGSERLLLNSEKMLLNLLCFDKSIFKKVQELIKVDDFSDPIHKKMAEIIYALRDEGERIDPAVIVSKFDNEESEKITSILHMEPNYENNEKAAMQLVDNILKQNTMLNDIQESITEGNVERLNMLLMEYKSQRN